MTARIQRIKALIVRIRQGGIEREEFERRVDEIFGKGSHLDIGNVTTREKIVERIVETSKTEQQFEEWERMRREEKRRQRDDIRINIFWRMNESFSKQFGVDEETPDAEETLAFWMAINNKEVSEGWREDRHQRCPQQSEHGDAEKNL